ncbi:MAG: RNA-directed DNA polymerase [Candidatus Marinimicrobia bacterium]|nr:RNA-directed DNA polymerase [Candidatus Neomarinimicrobiota bacterium]
MIKKPNYLAYILGYEYDVIKYVLDNIEKHYYEKKEPKINDDGTQKTRKGEPQYRILNPSKGLLEEIQNKIKIKIISKIQFPEYIFGGIRGKSNINNAKRHQGRKYHFCTDLQKFYPSVTYKDVYDMFINHSFSPDVSHILTLLTTYKGCLPQGTHTSPYLANLVFLPIDKRLLEFCKDKNIIYTRYVDDLSFSSSSNFKNYTFGLIDIINDCGYKINHIKTTYKIGPSLVTGIVVNNNNLDVREDQIRKLNDLFLPKSSRDGLFRYIQNVKNA